MFITNTKRIAKLIPVTALMISIMFSGVALADDNSIVAVTDSTTEQLQPLMNWNLKVQTALSTRMDNNLKKEMQALSEEQAVKTLYASQYSDDTDRDVVLISTEDGGASITARSTTPVVVIIDRKELCLVNL